MSSTEDDVTNTSVKDVFSGLYQRPDTDAGFITDESEIMQLKAIRKSDIINSQLLGEFDENGAYTIDKNIVVQLVRLPKLITKQNEYGTFATAKVDNKEFHFRMAPTRVVDGKLVSELELLEEIYHANGYIIDTRTTLLASYSYESVPNFEELARRAFHISTHPQDDDFGGDVGDGNGVLKPDEADYIKHRLAYLEAMGMVSLGLYERLEEAYFNKRIKILSSIPEAAVVLAEYKKQFSKVEQFFVQNSKRKYRAMNEILTAVIEGGKGENLRKNDIYRQQMREANKIYLKTILQIDESVKHSMEVINAVAKSMPVGENKEIISKNFVIATKKEQQNSKEKAPAKSAPKSSGPSKKGGKSFGGGGGKGGKSGGGKGGGGGKPADKKKNNNTDMAFDFTAYAPAQPAPVVKPTKVVLPKEEKPKEQEKPKEETKKPPERKILKEADDEDELTISETEAQESKARVVSEEMLKKRKPAIVEVEDTNENTSGLGMA